MCKNKSEAEQLRSTDTMGQAGWSYASFGRRVMETATRIGVERGVEIAISKFEQMGQEQRKDKQRRRLRSTRTLLQNYRALKKHAVGAVYSSAQAQESTVDILEGLEGFRYTSNLYIESIRQSEERTLIILTHIDKMLKFYRLMCEDAGPEAVRTCKVLMARYVEEPKKTTTQIAGVFAISDSTLYNDLKRGINDLSALIFGIDGLSFER